MSNLSDWLGWTSIACWLGAQFPQVLENHRRKSVEGLALPFLANWFFGDATNLLGCILTHQLPFQTYLATYFVFVDISLLSQYIYYTRNYPPKAPQTHSRAVSREREASRYRVLSAAAATVATAAALAAQHGRTSSAPPPTSGPSRRARRPSSELVHHLTTQEATGLLAEEAEVDDEVDEQALSALADSLTSETTQRTGKRVSWSLERRGNSLGRSGPGRGSVLPLTSAARGTDEADALSRRGRSSVKLEEAEEEEAEREHTRRNSRASQRGAGLVFLGVWALVGVGTIAGGGHSNTAISSLTGGRVLSATADFGVSVPAPLGYHGTLETPHNPNTVFLQRRVSEEEPSPSLERIIGRIFAWVCTTLYLTSRLPQIWKNFVRKSAEGLSVFLFIFAFLGNSFYVASILSSPNMRLPEPAASNFLKESIPYLLGSGGTLIFDVIIVTQTIIYRKPPARKRSTSKPRGEDGVEEQAGLLEDDALAQSLTDSTASIAQGRRRATSPSVVRTSA